MTADWMLAIGPWPTVTREPKESCKLAIQFEYTANDYQSRTVSNGCVNVRATIPAAAEPKTLEMRMGGGAVAISVFVMVCCPVVMT